MNHGYTLNIQYLDLWANQNLFEKFELTDNREGGCDSEATKCPATMCPITDKFVHIYLYKLKGVEVNTYSIKYYSLNEHILRICSQVSDS